MTATRPTAIDLFCGAGGMSLGFEQAGFDVLAAFDVEDFNVRTHSANFPDTKAIVADLSSVTGDELLSLVSLRRKEIDVVFGGPPCQGFSVGGRRDLNDKRNLLLYDFAKLVRQIKPKYFVMENVKGLMLSHAESVLKSFVRRVKRAGYAIVEPLQVLNAADYGVPQRRWRTFVLGHLKDLPAPAYPKPCGFTDDKGLTFTPIVKDAIEDLPVVEDWHELFESDVYPNALAATDSRYALLMRGEVRSVNDRSRPRPMPASGLTGCLRTLHSSETMSRFAATRPGETEPISRYIRLLWGDVAPTIRAGTGADHGSHTAPRPIHPEVPRCITAREAARLHSLPDWFLLHGTRWHDFRQIGNAVPPHLARAVAESVAKLLNPET